MSHGQQKMYRVIIYHSDGTREKIYEHVKQEKALSFLRQYVRDSKSLGHVNKIGIETFNYSYLDKRRWE